MERLENINLFLGGITKTKPDSQVNLDYIYQQLTSPGLKGQVEAIRAIKNPDPKELKKARNKLKKYLPYITPAGLFSHRRKAGLVQQSGLAPIDIDDLHPSKLGTIKDSLKTDPYVHFMFVSPSGEGLKIFIKIPTNLELYERYVCGFYAYLEREYSLPQPSLDAKTRDVSRACFLSHDPDTYWNKESKEFDMEADPPHTKTSDSSRSATEYREIIKLIFAGRTKEYIYDHMQSFEKWRESSEAYRLHTFTKAENYVASQHKIASDDRPPIIEALAQRCLEEFELHTIRPQGVNRMEMYIYRDGIYLSSAQSYLEEFVRSILKECYDKIIVSKMLDKIYAETYIDADDFFKEEDPRYILVQNGMLDLITGKLQPFDPRKKFFNKLPVTFDPEADCPVSKKHYNTILSEEDVLIIQELMGYILYRDYKYEHAFIFYGGGGNGKGKTIEQMKALIGIDNSVNIALVDIGNQFLTHKLHGKLANLSDDIGKEEIKETRMFKEVTGHGMITCDRKYLDPISFTNYAKLIFAANTLPRINDDTDAIWRRWIPIGFEVSFLSENEYNLLEQQGKLHPKHRKADTEIIEKLTTPEELSGLLNWAIVGLHRLFKNDCFSFKKGRDKVREIMRRKTSSVVAFQQDCLEIINNKDQYELHEDVYNRYVDYCFKQTKKLMPESDLEFRKILQDEGVPFQRKRVATGYELRWNYVKLHEVLE